MTVREMLGRIDSRELTEWLAFLNLSSENKEPEPEPEKQTSEQMKNVMAQLMDAHNTVVDHQNKMLRRK